MSSPNTGNLTPRKYPEMISIDEISLTERNEGFHRMRPAGPKNPKKKAPEDYFVRIQEFQSSPHLTNNVTPS